MRKEDSTLEGHAGSDPRRRAAPPVTHDREITRVLFLSTFNAARSQMAEGIMRELAGNRIAVFSAGTAPTAVHPYAVDTLKARGIDIREQRSRHLGAYRGMRFDYIVTLCACDREPCPTLDGNAKRLLWPVADPCEVEGSEEARQAAFARAAHDLEGHARAFLRLLEERSGGR